MYRGLKINIRRFGDDDNLKAFADVTIRVKFGEITIKRFKILQGEKELWVAFPQVQYIQNFSSKYVSLLNMNKRVEDHIKNQVLNEYRKTIKKS